MVTVLRVYTLYLTPSRLDMRKEYFYFLFEYIYLSLLLGAYNQDQKIVLNNQWYPYFVHI